MKSQNVENIEIEVERKAEKRAKKKKIKMKVSGAGVKKLQDIIRNKTKSKV